jgi:hypothetical protein
MEDDSQATGTRASGRSLDSQCGRDRSKSTQNDRNPAMAVRQIRRLSKVALVRRAYVLLHYYPESGTSKMSGCQTLRGAAFLKP